MKKLILACAVSFACVAAFADDLADANKALEAKAYAKAAALYTKLAAAGSAEAQFHLGEMHWYGEGVPADLAQARTLFEKAAAGGSKEAATALETMRQREVRKADIQYYASGYTGLDLAYSSYKCQKPEFPAVSQRKSDIKRIDKDYKDWLACYTTFAQGLKNALPPGKLIPADISNLMNEQEFNAAQAHMDKTYARLSAEARQEADPIVASYDSWIANTEKFVVQEAARFEQLKVEAEKQKSNPQMPFTNPYATGPRK
jgi:hypothetical protein